MGEAALKERAQTQAAEHFDVLIVGAGISGIGGAYHLQTECPGKSYVILENQDSFGGTWLTHTYPGIRSDSDLYTFGYKFKPWVGPPIASAPEILKYMNDVIDENDIARNIRYGHSVKSAEWSSKDRCWTLTAESKDGTTKTFTCTFLWMCQGYYRHSQGYTPEWKGMDRFKGQIIHPQTWPDDLDYKDKNVLVIGSGATAATLVPAMAPDCKHITLLQRSPTYFFPAENRNETAEMLRELDLPEEWVHEITRRKILHDHKMIIDMSFNDPETLKNELIKGAKAYLPEDFDIEKHFTPSYRPWQQRLAFLPEGDLFRGIKDGKASVVTDQIETFTEKGILLQSGEELEADIIVTATGFNLCMMGDVAFSVDGKAVDWGDQITYRGVMYVGVPNMAWVFGYFRTSWTMRADMIAEFVTRLLNHMSDKGVSVVTPQLRPEDEGMELKPFIDADNFNPGYIKRGLHLMPKQGDHAPWLGSQDYYTEVKELPVADLEDGALVYKA